MGFWNNSILEEKKEISLINRLIELTKFSDTECKFNNNSYVNGFRYPFSYIDKGELISIKYQDVLLYVSYVSTGSPFHHEYYGIINSENNSLEITEQEYKLLYNSVKSNIERSMLKTLYPFKSPELELLFQKVRTIQDGKEQIDFIMEGIQSIKNIN